VTRKPSKEAELSALRRAIAVERRAYYADFQGKHSTFSAFMRHTADRLCRRYPMDSVWATIRGLFREYPNLDVGTRISIIKRCEELLEPHWLEAANNAQRAAEAEALARGETLPGKESSSATAAAGGRPFVRPAKSQAKPVGDSYPTDKVKQVAEPKFVVRKEQSRAKDDPVRNAPGQSTAEGAPNSQIAFSKRISDIPVQFVKQVGPKGAQLLTKLGIDTVEDLLRHYPRRHLDFNSRSLIKELKPGQDVTIFGSIRSVSAFQSKNRNISVISILIGDGTGSIGITRFIGGRSNKYLLDRYKGQFPKGAQVLASGQVELDKFGSKLLLKNAEIEVLGELNEADSEDLAQESSASASLHAGRIVPVYPLTEGLGLRHLRNIIHNALQSYGASIEDPLPEALRVRLDLCDLAAAYQQIHFPQSLEGKDEARRRLVFDELFSIQLYLAQRRHKFDTTENALILKEGGERLVNKLLDSLPFKLTKAQERVFGEIRKDLLSPRPLHRLVQGDVGSGKTIVALLSCLLAIEDGYQCAMMAPTEILAEQHFRQFQRLLAPLGLRCALVVGKQGQKERREVRQQLVSGQIHIAVGTHALLEEDVEFSKLGLIIIDEQHRFGVKQRARLKAKSVSPELLTMTATPIPRTLALTMHGDLDVSEIDEMPPGRKPIDTRLLRPSEKRDLYKEIRLELERGRQAYIVFPLIEESETLSAKAATIEFERLQTEKEFQGFNIGLMHGRLRPQEKDEVMEQFRTKQYHILVSTTVIEVGVDVPNATIMVIENADRFGLAQLHQLRGRVGRGADQSYCYLIADSKAEATRERLGVLTETNDGFVVAEKDLELRGPGEFLGYRQSGLPDLLLADLVKDAKILEEARHAAIEIVKQDPQLDAYPSLKLLLARRSSGEESEIVRSG
jgi:ATP-dependent DNA helicase RecG